MRKVGVSIMSVEEKVAEELEDNDYEGTKSIGSREGGSSSKSRSSGRSYRRMRDQPSIVDA